MSFKVMSSPRHSSHYEEKEKVVAEPIQTMSTDDQGSVTKDSGLVLLKNRYYCQEDTSDNKQQVTKKKPPPLFIDIQEKRQMEELQHNNNSLQQNNSSSATPLKSPSASVRLMDLGPLDHDEQHELEEEIKARRLARRQQKKRTYADDDDEEEEQSRTTIGTRVAEGHRNYQMMYDMLTGIRIAVGRVSAKIQRDLTPEDFTAAHKLVFDV